jgi:hypothetical protein
MSGSAKGSDATRTTRANAAKKSAEKDVIRAYVADQAREVVVHAEKAASELVGPVRHDIWDVHCSKSRWWVVTNPTNLYSQNDFKSRDVVLSFHVGLMLRVSNKQERKVPVTPTSAELLPGSWRRWQQAFEAYESGDEAENFQAVGVRLRECLVSFTGETRSDDLVPAGTTGPKGSDFKGWTELLANHLAAGESLAKLRSYLKKNAVETWEYVNWLTHAKNAVRLDAEIGLKAVEHLLGVFTAARLRQRYATTRCGSCSSYGISGGTCKRCGWVDPGYEAPQPSTLSKSEVGRRLAEPCVPSSDISTLMTADEVLD